MNSDPWAHYYISIAGAMARLRIARDKGTPGDRAVNLRGACGYIDAALALLSELEPPPPMPAVGVIDDETA